MTDAHEQRLIEQFVAHPTIEALDEGVLGRLARRGECHAIPACSHQASTALDVSSVPLSLTIMPGLPRQAISLESSRTTRLPEIEVSGTAARHSRVTSSTMLSTRNRRPVANWSCTKSRLQRWLGSASTSGGVRVPTARLRPLRRRTVRPSSR